MKNRSVFQKILLFLGIALLCCAVVSACILLIENRKFNVNCSDAVKFIEQALPDRVSGVKEDRFNNEMPSVQYEGQDYAALLTVRRLSVKLPVRSSWDRNAANKVPCLYTGSAYDGTLIIGGADAAGQFDFIPRIDIGDEIIVTDMKGYEFKYTVSTVKHAKNAKKATLIDEKYDLTLFAKDTHSGDWLLVRCVM